MSESFQDDSTAADRSFKSIPPNEYAIQSYCKKVLKSRVFLAKYCERRLVSETIGYRDIISVSDAEIQFKKDVQSLQKRLKEFYPAEFWVGITHSEKGDFLWVELSNVAFGVHWFQVKTVRFRRNEAIVKLQCIRSLHDAAEIPRIIAKENNEIDPITVESIKEYLSQCKQYGLKTAIEVYMSFTFENIFSVVKFLIVAVVALVTGTFCVIGNLGDFTIRLFRETSFFINASTPVMLGFMDFCSKIIGGFYLLLAMVLPKNNQTEISYMDRMGRLERRTPRKSIMDSSHYQSGVTVTEVD